MTNANDQQQELNTLLEKIKVIAPQHVELNKIASICKTISQESFIELLRTEPSEYAIVDVRSESEFEENPLPQAVIAPILTNQERHEVGLLYKQHSVEKAVDYAYSLAQQKEEDYLKQVKQLVGDKKVVIYCWRGGARSRYCVNLLTNNGIDAVQLIDGHKGFREQVHDLLYNGHFSIISLSGLTGCGKSEIIEIIQRETPSFPTIHLEKCARHASSVFGEIRFKLLNMPLAKNQKDFEQNLFLEVLKHKKNDETFPTFLSEKESKKIGNFIIPPAIFDALQDEKHIELLTSTALRAKRLEDDYFKNGNEWAKNSVKSLLTKLTRHFSKETLEQYNNWIDSGKYQAFLENILIKYYDVVYKKTNSPPIATLENIDPDKTIDLIKTIFTELK